MNNLKQLRVKAYFDTNVEKVNPLFSKVKIRIAYTGENRNNSYISKEAFEKALPTIYNCPIIGEFVETVEDFGGHGGKIEISDKGIQYIHTTKPYGVINENSEITWEDVIEEDGTVNTYLCATGYLWTGRYEELTSVVENSKNQSMEIEISKGEFKKINDKDLYAIDDFIFSAFCILGEDVEPCFESSSVTAYSFNKEEFKEQFNEMLSELKKFNLQDQSSDLEVDNINFSAKEGKKLNEKLELIAKYGLIIEELDFSIEEISLEDLEEKLKEFTKEEDKKEVSFSATYRQKRDALNNALDPKIERDNDGNLIREECYYVSDFNDEYVYVERNIWTADNYENTYGRYTYAFDVETLTATITSEFEEMVLTWLTIEENQKLQEERNNANAEYEKLKTEFDEYKNNYSTPNSEGERLENFEKDTLINQRIEAEEILFTQFDEKLKGVEEYEALKTKTSEFDLEDLEKECFVILGKQSANFTVKPTKKEKVKIEFNKAKNQEQEDEFGDLFDRYLKK